MSAPDKAEIERKLDEEWRALKSLVDALSEVELEQPGAVEQWSVKDLLGHMAFWAQKAAGDLALAAGGKADKIEVPGGEEQVVVWNAREAESRRGKSLDAVKREWTETMDAAKSALREAPAGTLDLEVKGWTMFTRFAEDTYRHYREHAAQIREWQRQMETTEA